MHAEVKREMITSTTPYLTLRTKENILSKSRLCETFIENDIRKKIIPIYRANFSGSNGIKILSMRQIWRVLRGTKRSKYGSAVKCGTAGKPSSRSHGSVSTFVLFVGEKNDRRTMACDDAGKRKCGKVRYCGVKGYAVKCGTAGQGVKEYTSFWFTYGELLLNDWISDNKVPYK